MAKRLWELLPSEQLHRDEQVSGSLSGFFPRNLRPQEIGPTEWMNRRDVILAEASSESKILCLFDRDLHFAPGFHSESGLDLLRDAVNKYDDDRVLCGLFTYTVSEDDEMDQWRLLAVSNGIGLEKFLVIAKERTSSPLSFVDAVKKTVINLYFEPMKNMIVQVIENANKSAKEDLLHVDVYDFEHILLESYNSEGSWEADAILRLYDIFHRDYSKKALVHSDSAAVINNNVIRARAVRQHVETQSKNAERIWTILHKELYESGEIINLGHVPLELGDVFEIIPEKGEVQTYILLAQPCDLMVRPNGSRGETFDRFVSLVPIKVKQENELNMMNHDAFRVRGLVRYIARGTNQVGIVEFGKSVMVNTRLLDLAVLNADGRCHLDLTTAYDIPVQFYLPWRNRVEKLIQRYQSFVDEISLIEPGAVDSDREVDGRIATLWKMVLSQLVPLEMDIPRIPYKNGVFDFSMRRTMRYRKQGAERLLNAYSLYLSRAADEVDFGRDLNTPNVD